MRYCRMVLAIFIAVWLFAGFTRAQTPDDKKMQAYIDLMRKDLRVQKQALIDEGMGLEAAEKSQFWAIYDGYQTALNAIWDQRLANVRKYADNFDHMTDQIADELAVKMMDLEGQRTALKKKYYSIFKEKMGARVAARFLQVESILASFMDLKIGSEIPLLH